MSDDASLLEKLKAGSPVAWDEAFHRLYPSVFTAARHPLAGLDINDAEDVAIDALRQLIPLIETVGTWDELRAVAVTIASRRAISEKRKLTADKRGGGHTESLDDLHEKSEGVFEPAALVESISPTDLHDLAGLLNDAMEELDDLTRHLIRQFVMDGASYKELAEKHRIPIGTVGVHLSRGLKKIRSRVEKSPILLKELTAYLRS